MPTYVHLGAALNQVLSQVLDPAKNEGLRLVTVDMRAGATRELVLNAIAAEFPTADYPLLTNGNRELFRDILSDWMLSHWETSLEVEVLLSERDCREQLTLLHDIAAAFHYAKDAAVHERANQQQFEGIADADRVLRMYVFEAG